MDRTEPRGLSLFDPRRSLPMACAVGSYLTLLAASIMPVWEETYYPYSLLWIPDRITLWTVAFRLPEEGRSVAGQRGRGWEDALGALVERHQANLFLAVPVLMAGAVLGGLAHWYGWRRHCRGLGEPVGGWREGAYRLWWLAPVVVLLGVGLWYYVERGWTPQKMERMIAANLPPGTSRAQVGAASTPWESTTRPSWARTGLRFGR